jgi:AAA+ superfamily predicted ATPase
VSPVDAPLPPYADDVEHLGDELRRLDLLLRIRAERLFARLSPPSQVERSIYISHAEARRLLDHDPGPEVVEGLDGADTALHEMADRIERRLRSSQDSGVTLALPRLGRLFGLSRFELQSVVICLAPELRRKYDRIYAYLQDDITRQRPSVDLVLELLCDTEVERWRHRHLLGEGAPLRRAGLLRSVLDQGSPSGSSGLAQILQLDPRITGYLLGERGVDARLDGHATLCVDSDGSAVDPGVLDGVLRLVEARLAAGRPRTVVHLFGPGGAGKGALAREVCARRGVPLLALDVRPLLSDQGQAAVLIPVALREGLLRQCPVLLAHADELLAPDARSVLAVFGTAVRDHGQLVFTSGAVPWPAETALGPEVVASVEVPATPVPLRAAVWQQALSGRTEHAAGWAAELATRYRLTPARIRAATAAAEAQRQMRPDRTELTVADLASACRAQSDQRIAALAEKVDLRHGWADLVLPEPRLVVLREICAQVRHHHRVIEEWGFGRRLGHGTGLSALFSGPPGTGKTLAAQVLAREVGLDLYRVDLARVVSKYIGETEKNLSRVFDEAETSNAVLFFDEADALFGKRSEVSDAHDRYANIEISYLLQRMEDYQGVVVLATNLRQNLDEAFTRRIRFLVDFPFPDESQRRRIWQTHFPPCAPVAPEVDCEFLAREFPLAGGSIKNIVLNAAFLAAADGGIITPEHLVAGTRREFDKAGKVWREPVR